MPDRALAARPSLTRRQQEVLALIAAGESDKDIAEKLRITTNTVQAHAWKICIAWGVGTREELYLTAADEADTTCATCTATTEARSLARLLGAAEGLLADISAQLPKPPGRKAVSRG